MEAHKAERAFEPDATPAQTNRSPDGRESYDERRNHILVVATDLIARVGYERASMREVAKAAGVSLAGLYHYFENKEKILFLVQFRTFSFLISSLREQLHGVSDPVEQLRVTVRTHVGHFAANMAALKVCSHELDSLTGDAYEETSRLRHEYYNIARGIVDRIFDTLAPDSPLDRHIAAMSLFGTLNWLYRWYDPKLSRSPSSVANQIVTQFLGGILNTDRAIQRARPDE